MIIWNVSCVSSGVDAVEWYEILWGLFVQIFPIFFCLLVWAPQLLCHTCSYVIFVGCWLYSLSAACIHMHCNCYSVCLMEMLLWSSRIISVLDDIKQDGAVPVPQYWLYCGTGTDGWECGVGFVCIFHISGSVQKFAVRCVYSTPNSVLCNHETCVAPADSDMHLEKVNVSACTVFNIFHLS